MDATRRALLGAAALGAGGLALMQAAAGAEGSDRGNPGVGAGCDRGDGLRPDFAARGSGDSANRLPKPARFPPPAASRRGADPGCDRCR